MSFFHTNLKYLMDKYNYKNVRLAALLGVTKGTISNYLAGYEPKKDNLVKLSKLFCCPVETLLGTDLTGHTLREEVSTTPTYMIPFFLRRLCPSAEDVYIPENFDVSYYFPIPVCNVERCYAVKLYDDESILDAGLPSKSIAIYARDMETPEGEVAAVHRKDLAQIFIRRVHYNGNMVTLTSDKSKEVFDVEDKNCPITLLGKVVAQITFAAS